MLANFKTEGNFEVIVLLKFSCMKTLKRSRFCFINFIGISDTCEALFVSKLCISFRNSSLFISENEKVPKGPFVLIARMLGWFLYFSIAFKIELESEIKLVSEIEMESEIELVSGIELESEI